MHVLKQIHRWLRHGGVLLDLHPEPEQPTVEVVAASGVRRVYLGRIDTTALSANIHRARPTLRSVVEDGWFEPERSVVFDFVSHFSSVDEWLRNREARRSTSVVAPAIIDRARELLSARMPGELIVSERVHATCLKGGNTPGERTVTSPGAIAE